ncbi:MAG: helix-hairpin-helix domain-containing protein, partial [Myxococcales bacterium]
DPLVLRSSSAELFVLTRARDEAHRFAITFHQKLRRARNFRSVLEEIPGIGEGRKRALLRHFGALKRVREATVAEIAGVDGFGPKQAQAVHEFFHREGVAAEGEPVTGLTEADAADAEPVTGLTEADLDAALAGDAPSVEDGAKDAPGRANGGSALPERR